MRVSVNKYDPGYITNGKDYKVTLDGEPAIGCVTADDELNEVVRYQLDVSGRPRVNAEGTGFLLETVRGKRVGIEAPAGPAPARVTVEYWIADGDVPGMRIFVYSQAFPKNSKTHFISAEDMKSLKVAGTRKRVHAAAVVLTGAVNDTYRDRLDPDECAKWAVEEFDKLIGDMGSEYIKRPRT